MTRRLDPRPMYLWADFPRRSLPIPQAVSSFSATTAGTNLEQMVLAAQRIRSLRPDPFAFDDMVDLAHKRGTKVLLKGMNPGVRLALHELSVLKSIGEENLVKDFDAALEEAIDYLGNQSLGSPTSTKMSMEGLTFLAL